MKLRWNNKEKTRGGGNTHCGIHWSFELFHTPAFFFPVQTDYLLKEIPFWISVNMPWPGR